MAYLQGEGAMTNINLIVKTHFNNVTKNGKSQFLDAMVDHRDPRGPSQTNLHLVSRKQEHNGKTSYNNGAGYSMDQFEKIKAAAGPNTEPVTNKDGEQIGEAFAIKASVMPAKGGLIINTNKRIDQSDFKMEPNTLNNQFESMKAAKQARQAEKTAEAQQAQTAQPEAVPAPAAEAQVAEPEPSIG
jgi:hypothetical protein